MRLVRRWQAAKRQAARRKDAKVKSRHAEEVSIRGHPAFCDSFNCNVPWKRGGCQIRARLEPDASIPDRHAARRLTE
jgi:hypothetical protein